MNNSLPLVIGEWACSKGRREIGERGRAIAVELREARVYPLESIVLQWWCLLHQNGGTA